MSLALGRDGAVYLATRSEIFLLRGKATRSRKGAR